MTKKIKNYLKSLFTEIKKDEIFTFSAALSFHTVFALAPIFIIFISIGSIFFGYDQVYSSFVSFFQSRFGDEVASFFSAILVGKEGITADILFAFFGLIIIIYASSNLFNHIQEAFFRIFGVRFKEKNSIKKGLEKRFLSFLYMVSIFIIFFTLVFGNIVITIFTNIYSNFLGLPGDHVIGFILNHSLGIIIVFVLFSLTYKAMSANSIKWKDAFLGAVFATIFFLIINSAISYYISVSVEVALYGASGFLVAFLFWIYYSFAFILIGAEIAKLNYLRNNKSKDILI